MAIETGIAVSEIVQLVVEEVNQQKNKNEYVESEIINAGEKMQRLLRGAFILDFPLQKKIYLKILRKRSKIIRQSLDIFRGWPRNFSSRCYRL